MQDRKADRSMKTSCDARPDHTLGHERRFRGVHDESGLPPIPERLRHCGESTWRANTRHDCNSNFELILLCGDIRLCRGAAFTPALNESGNVQDAGAGVSLIAILNLWREP
jgi:hypothetical protein